jgi:hypothetical protein
VPPAVTVTILLAAGAAALWGMRAGWRHRAVRTSDAVPTLQGARLQQARAPVPAP